MKLQALVWLMLCTSAFAAPPDFVQATYEVQKSGLQIEIKESYTRDKDHYKLSSIWTPLGLLAMLKPEKFIIDSNGLIGKQGLQPLYFSHRRELEERRNSSAEFDWEAKKLTLIQHAQRLVVALPDGTQDRLSAMYQFMFLSLQNVTTLDFQITNGSKLDDYRYAITRHQTLKVPAGEFEVIYLDSQPKPGETRSELWLATQYHNLPCKVVVTEPDGGKFTQVLSKLVIRP